MGKTTIMVSCLDQQLTITDGPVIASGGRNEDEIRFEFCPLWEGFGKTAVFHRDGGEPYQAAITDDRCLVPSEVLQTEGFMFFGVFGVKGDAIRTSEVIKYKIVKGALTEASTPSEPTPDIYEQFLTRAGELEAQYAEVKAELAEQAEAQQTDIVAVRAEMAEQAEAQQTDIVAVRAELAEQSEAHDTDIAAVRAELGSLAAFDPQPFTASGGLIQVQTYEGAPLECVTTFEPVQASSGDPSPDNIRPISGRTSAKLTRCGKNLFPSSYATYTVNGMTAVEANDGVLISGTPTAAYASVIEYNIKLAPGIYTISGGTGPSEATYAQIGIHRADGTREYVYNRSFEVYGDEISLICIVQAGATPTAMTNYLVQPQIELGSTATDYEPYQGDTYEVDFGETVYGGRLDWTTGVLTVEWFGRTFDGTETPHTVTENGNTVAAYIRLDADLSVNNVDAMCSHFVRTYNTEDTPHFYISTKNYNLFIPKANLTSYDVSGVQTYLAAQYAAGTPVQIAYKLAEPYEIQLTAYDIHALHGLNTIFSDGGETAVSGRNDILWLTSHLIERIKTLEAALAAATAEAEVTE